MSYIKADTRREQQYFDYLEELRQSGDTNMWGASEYLQTAFGLNDRRAGEILIKWIRLHDDPAKILDKPVTKQRPHRKVTSFVR